MDRLLKLLHQLLKTTITKNCALYRTACPRVKTGEARAATQVPREFTKGGLVKGV